MKDGWGMEKEYRRRRRRRVERHLHSLTLWPILMLMDSSIRRRHQRLDDGERAAAAPTCTEQTGSQFRSVQNPIQILEKSQAKT